jgi:hypothetical protein
VLADRERPLDVCFQYEADIPRQFAECPEMAVSRRSGGEIHP